MVVVKDDSMEKMNLVADMGCQSSRQSHQLVEMKVNLIIASPADIPGIGS